MKGIFGKITHFFCGSRREREEDGNSNSTVQAKEDEIRKNEPCDFESAITETKFGKFNLLLILIAIPSGWASMFESTAMSYVIPVAQDDLEMSLEQKGYLISITYCGMLSSAIIWGFLSDTLGRKKLLVIGYLTDAFFNIIASLSQNYATIMFAKFMGGFIVNGPFAVLTTTLSEFHCAKYRAKVLLYMGIIFTMANIVLPLVGLVLLATKFDWKIMESFTIHSWHAFLLVATLPSLISGIGHMFFPESPKFLMTAGRNEEALEVFRKVYAMNTGKPPETYPITKLIDETAGDAHFQNRSKWVAFKDGFGQMKPLFFAPHLKSILLVCTIQLGCMMGLNTLRLWLPQLFTAINDYQTLYNGSDSTMCQMLDLIRPQEVSDAARENLESSDYTFVYLNSMLVAVASLIGYLFIGSLINILGKKRVYIGIGITSAACGFCIYFTQNSASAIGVSSVFIALAGINTNVVLTIVVDLFPTSLRTMAVALAMMSGRGGAMMGNIIFPHLLNAGCVLPFLFIGISTVFCTLMAFLLPKTDLKPLE